MPESPKQSRALPVEPVNRRLGEMLSGVLLGALVLLMFGAFVVFRNTKATVAGNEMNVDRAVFNVVNAATLSGFQLSTTVNDFLITGQVTVFVLISIATLVYLVVGGWALVRIVGMPMSDAEVVRAALWAYAFAAIVGGMSLMGPGAQLWPAVFNSVSALGNAGHWLGEPPKFLDWRTHMVVLPLALLGGSGIPAVQDLLSSFIHFRRPHPHTMAVLTMTAVVYLAAITSIYVVDRKIAGNGQTPEARRVVAAASGEALDARTLGMPLESFGALTRSSQWIVMLLMAVGAATAGSGGGIKTTTLFVLGRDSVRAMLGRPVGRLIGVAVIWLVAYVLLAVATTLLLIANFPQESGERMLFLAVSALSNVGTTDEPLRMTKNGLYILTFAMLLGRFLPLAILAWVAGNVKDGDADVGVV